MDSQTGWIVTYEGYIYQTLDGGQNWTRKRPVGYELTSVYFIDRQNGWITGNKRTILRSQDGGESWKYITEGSNERHETSYGQRLKTGDEPLHSFILFEMSFVSDQTGWIVGDLGVILKTEDGGNTWQHQSSGTNRDLFGLYFVNEKQGWVVGDGGLILHTQDGGQDWKIQKRIGERWLYSVYFVDEKKGWVVGIDGLILHTQDGGKKWVVQPTRLKNFLKDLVLK